MKTDTPRTDTEEYNFYDGHFGVDVEFARQLERENSKLRKALLKIARSDIGDFKNTNHAFLMLRHIAGEATKYRSPNV